jgi:uncharacterized protein YdeI (YjbR/CyaY-like superfamily)
MPQKARAGEAFERVEIASRKQWRSWLSENFRQGQSIWLVVPKKHMGAAHVPYDDIVEEALCFGWVDSLVRKLNEDRSMLLVSPRKPSSNWSALNKARVEKLTAQGLMTPAGQEKIDLAKASGKWNALDDVETLSVPADLAKAIAAVKGAKASWDAFPPSARRGILEWIKNAKAPDTRAKRVNQTAELAGRNIRANQPGQKLPVASVPARKTSRKAAKS